MLDDLEGSNGGGVEFRREDEERVGDWVWLVYGHFG
jgi:hypothetical protein